MLRRFHPAWCAVLAAALYAWTVSFGYVAFDDPWLIQNNPLLAPSAELDLGRILFDFSPETRMILGAEYLPLRDVSTWIDGQLFGTWAGGRHLVNALLYAVVVALFGCFALLVFRGQGRWTAWFATLLFTLHPVHVEAVAWLSERKGLLSMCAILSAVLFAAHFARTARWKFAALAVLFYALSIFSKSVAVVTPGAFAALAWCFDDRSAQKRVWTLAGVALLIGAVLIQPTLAVGSKLAVIQPEHHTDVVARLLLFCELHGRYLALMFLALPNAPHYAIDAHALNVAFASLGGLVLIVGAYICLRGKGRSAVRLGAAWWFLFLFPVSHVVFSLQNLMADRYLLLPSAGFSLVIASLLNRLSRRVRAIPAGFACLLAAALTMMQLPVWRDSETLFHRLVDLQPQVDHHWNQWAAHLRSQGRAEDALSVTLMGIERAGATPALLHRRGLLRISAGDAIGGFTDIEAAATNSEAKPKYQANYALLLMERGRADEALKYAKLAADRAPLYAHMQRVLGLVQLQRGAVPEARKAFELALRLEPQNPVNRKNLTLAQNHSP